MSDPTAENVLLKDWYATRELPPFSEINPEHFGPAYDKALAEHKAEIEAIAADTAPPTFDNTIERLQLSGLRLARTSGVFWNLAGSHTNDEIQALERELAPRLSAHFNEITANETLFARINGLWLKRETLGLNDEQARVLERTHQDFVRAGARLQGAEKERLGQIKQRLAELGTTFSQNVRGDEAEFVLPIHDPADLAGLPDYLLDAMSAAAKERNAEVPHVVTLSRSLIDPFLTYSDRRDLRERAFRAWTARGENVGPRDNRKIIEEVLALRQERAKLLGFPTFADYKLDNCMAKTPAAVSELLETVWQPALRQALLERDALAELASHEGANIEIEPWDWRYWSEKVRQRDFDLDESEIKAYLPLDQVIEAAFHVANRLFGLAFTPRTDLDLYHPDVLAWQVTDRDGKAIGTFLGDYFARTSKRSGAWMSVFRGQQKLGQEIRPVVVNVMNFAKGSEGSPSLLSFDDARTLFHEFGHGLHGLLSDVTYPSLAGTSVERDFVELPSQLYEHWLETPDVLARYARHYKTGEPMPQNLIDRIKAASNFNQGFATVEYLASALVDIAFHSDRYKPGTDPAAFEAEVLASINMPREITMRHRSPHFLHVFSGDGYSAGYYSYMWSEVLDADAFAAFEEAGDVFDPHMAERLYTCIYSAGGRREGAAAYQAFRGKLPSVDGLLRQRGLAA